MKLAIIGFGRLGKEVNKLTKGTEIEVVMKINSQNVAELNASNLRGVDVALELSGPESATKNLKILAENRINTVCGSTGWLNDYNSIVNQFISAQTGLLYASNFSLGMNLAFELNRYAAQLFAQFEFTPRIEETHHVHKKDKPSGTAISLAEDLIKNNGRIKDWKLNDSVESITLGSHNLPIISYRRGEVVGSHTVSYGSEFEEFSISHEALDRKTFAAGALTACKWLFKKKGIFDMKDVLGIKKEGDATN